MSNVETKFCCICDKSITDKWVHKKIGTPSGGMIVIDEYVCSKCDEKKKPRLTYKMILEAMKIIFSRNNV